MTGAGLFEVAETRPEMSPAQGRLVIVLAGVEQRRRGALGVSSRSRRVMFPLAAQPDIIRAHQKDEVYIRVRPTSVSRMSHPSHAQIRLGPAC